MKSSKQRRSELKTARRAKVLKRIQRLNQELVEIRARYLDDSIVSAAVAVSRAMLMHHNSYSDPEFLKRGTYLGMAFTCMDCGKNEVWTATQQKWWYEVAKGDLFSVATRCRPCRRKQRARKADARRVHLEGVERKNRREI